MAQAFARTFRRRSSRGLFTVQRVLQLSLAELARLFGVSRRVIEQWISDGVPIRYVGVVDRTAEFVLYLNRLLKSQRLPSVAREKLDALGNRSILDVLRAQGTEPMYAFLHSLYELVPDADPVVPKVSKTETGHASDAYQLPIEDVVKKLVALAGVVVTGIVGNVKNERAVRQWIIGERHPTREPQLRFAYHVASMIAEKSGSLVVQSWFKGANASLGDCAPAVLLRDDFSEETQSRILNAVGLLRQ